MSTASNQPGSGFKRMPERRSQRSGAGGPRKVRNGLKLQSKQWPPPEVEHHLIAAGWRKLMQARIHAEAFAAGVEYAKSGQIVDVQVRPGLIEAHVQGTAARPYLTQIRLPIFDDQEWKELIEAMSGEAMYAARLLSGELPGSIVELAASRQMRFFPAPEDVKIECTCGAGECKHAAAMACIVTERLLADSTLMLTVRGREPQHVLDQLRRTRSMQQSQRVEAGGGPGKDLVEADPLIPETQVAAPPLEACLEEFWRGGPRLAELDELTSSKAAEHVPHALLRRLGPSPMSGKFPLVGLLASVYDTVAEAARKLREDGAGA